MDLRSSYPRSPREILAGHVHLARMIDKCRAVLAGTEGEYVYPCPLDQRLLEFVQVSADQFTEAVRTGSDAEVAEWLLANAAPHAAEEIEAWNEMMVTRGPDTEEKWERFRGMRDAVDPARTDITSWVDLLDLEEKRPVPRREAASPSTRPV